MKAKDKMRTELVFLSLLEPDPYTQNLPWLMKNSFAFQNK